MLADKLQEFYDALVAIKTALIAKDVVVSKFTLDLIAGLVGQIQTQRNMGSQTVTFKQNAIIFGIKITESERDPVYRVSYLDDAQGRLPVTIDAENKTVYNDWDKEWIFDKFKPCMLKTSGEVDYYLDPNDQSKKVDGSNSAITDRTYDGNAMVEIEKFYINFSMNGEDEEIRISNVPLDNYIPMGFYREDDSEADKIYVAMFRGSLDEQNKLRSIGYQNISTNRTYDEIKKFVQANGEGYGIESWAINQVLSTVFLVLIKRFDFFTIFTSGSYSGNPISGHSISETAISNRGSVKLMWLEYYFNRNSDFASFEDGLIGTNGKIFVKMKPPYSTTLTGSGYKQITDYVHNDSTSLTMYWIAKMKCSNDYGRIPVEYTHNSYSQYFECAQWMTPKSNRDILSVRDLTCFWGRNVRSWNSTQTLANAALTYLPPN